MNILKHWIKALNEISMLIKSRIRYSLISARMHPFSIFREAAIKNDANDLNKKENVFTKSTMMRFIGFVPFMPFIINYNEMMDICG